MSEEAEEQGGRVFFARTRRAPDRDSEIRLISAGIDIGSSTTHLAFSRLMLHRRGIRTRVSRRELLHESDIILTPYGDAETIDTAALGRFIEAQYAQAGIGREMIDTGALILTGLAARQRNARAIGELFAQEAGRFVAVAAGDGLETVLSAQGSGAVAASVREGAVVMNVDIGGGTSKIAVCRNGVVTDLTTIDIGARVIRLDAEGLVSGIEPAGQVFADDAGVALSLGAPLPEGGLRAIAGLMAQRLFEACGAAPLSDATRRLLRLPPLGEGAPPDRVSFSGGVAEYLQGREARDFGDLGPFLAEAVAARLRGWGPVPLIAEQGIRATVIGASQYSVQLSGNTIFVAPESTIPLYSLPVIAPALALDQDDIDPDAVAQAIGVALRRMDLAETTRPVALAYRWQGDATHARLDAFATGVGLGLAPLLAKGLPLVLVGESDVGGIIGIHCREKRRLAVAVVSIDGIAARELDFIDIGEMLQVSGGVPVVVKSLVFPAGDQPTEAG